MKRTMISVLLAAVLALSSACGSHVPPALQAKATATYTIQGVGDAIDAAYKLELVAAPLVPDPTQKQILLGFALAFDKVAEAATKLQTFKPGDAVPDSLNGAIDTIRELATFLADAPYASIQNVAKQLNKALDIAEGIVKVIKGGGSVQVTDAMVHDLRLAADTLWALAQ